MDLARCGRDLETMVSTGVHTGMRRRVAGRGGGVTCVQLPSLRRRVWESRSFVVEEEVQHLSWWWRRKGWEVVPAGMAAVGPRPLQE